MTDIEAKYNELKKEYNSSKLMSFLTEFTNDNNRNYLNFHYSLLKDKDNLNLFYNIRAAFQKRKEIGSVSD